jgi:hypothetical protein
MITAIIAIMITAIIAAMIIIGIVGTIITAITIAVIIFFGDIVDDVEDAEASSIGELIVDEVEGPACVRVRFHQDRRPGACRLAAGPTLTDSEPFLPMEPVDPVDPRRLALPPQQDEQPAIAEPAAFIGQLAQPGA